MQGVFASLFFPFFFFFFEIEFLKRTLNNYMLPNNSYHQKIFLIISLKKTKEKGTN
jgi:hypothetical protein